MILCASCSPEGFCFALLSIVKTAGLLEFVLLDRPYGEGEAQDYMEEDYKPRKQGEVRP